MSHRFRFTRRPAHRLRKAVAARAAAFPRAAIRRGAFFGAYAAMLVLSAAGIQADDWPRWRGPGGNAVSREQGLPAVWSAEKNVRWKTQLPGEGTSSPIVCGERVFITTAWDGGLRRALLCLDRDTGRIRWTREIEDEWPEIASALTGHAAPTPVTDGKRVVAFFGNAGVLGCDQEGNVLWRRELGDFETEFGLASSPIVYRDMVIVVCDHDGDRFRTFDSFLIALDVHTGATKWKTERPGLFRSWSTPILVPVGKAGGDDATNDAAAENISQELVVAAQDELRGYDPQTGRERWKVSGLTGWVAPSPVFAAGMIFAASGKDGPTLAVRPGGRGDVSETHVVWNERRGAPYISSPVAYGEYLYVPNELGVVTCREIATGRIVWQRRLEGKFIAAPVAADGKVYLPAESGRTYVLAAGPVFQVLAENDLGEEMLASPAIAHGRLFLRTRTHLYCLHEPPWNN